MRIVSATVYAYMLELSRPLVLGGETVKNREGLILHLTSEEGAEGFGEIAPLPGFSLETLKEAREQICCLKDSLRAFDDVPRNIKDLNGSFAQWIDAPDLKPSVRFGVESAVLNLMASAKKISLSQLISKTIHPQIKVSGLLSGARDEIAMQTKQLLAERFTSLKLKVGENIDDAIIKVRTVNDIAYGKALLHIDVNQAWDFDTAVTFGKEIGCAAVSYIEEPFKDIERIPEFFDETMIPVALDESLRDASFEHVRSISGVDVLVLKPTLLGGIERTRQIVSQAEHLALETVISSSFESSLGMFVLAELAATSSYIHTAAGLNTLKYFKTDLLYQPLHFLNGALTVGTKPNSTIDVDFGQLRELK